MDNRKGNAGWRLVTALLFVIAWISMGTVSVSAGVAEPTGDREGKEDYRIIQSLLASDGEVRLKSGETYYIVKPIILNSDQTILAKGAKIICLQGAFRSDTPRQDHYKSIKNVTVDGGTWTNIDKEGLRGSMIQFAHGQNITIKNLEVSCNYAGHAIELIAVKDTVVDNCKVKPLGYCPQDCHEEQIQIDISTPATAPKVAAGGQNLVQGQTCENVTVKNCTVSGARGICANFTKTENGKYLNKFHKNIVIKNNKIEGKTGEALALFNVIGATVEGNTITNNNGSIGESYSVGLHIAMFGKAPSAMNSAVMRVKNNVIKGGRQGMLVYSHSSSQYGKLIMQKNKCYAKAGKEKAYEIHFVKQPQVSKNQKYAW